MSYTKILKEDLHSEVQSVINNSSYLGGKVPGMGSLPLVSNQDTVVYVAASKKFVVYRSGNWEDVAGGIGGGVGGGVTELAGLDDVDLSDLILTSSGQTLVWDAAAERWKAGSPIADTSALQAQIDLINTNLNLKSNINSPFFTGNPQAPHPSIDNDSNSIATTAFVKSQGYITATDLGLELSVIDGGTF